MAMERRPRKTSVTSAAPSDAPDASAASDARIEFMDLVSHGLRSPLTALSGTAQLLQRRLRGDPERAADAADLDKILYQAARLANQVDVLLAATHLAQQRFEIVPVECEAVAAMRRVTGAFAAAANRGRTISFASDAAGMLIEADRKRLEELLTILLSNAVKFSARGDVAVCVTHSAQRLRVQVADHGIGVPATERRHIFEPYVRGSNNTTNSPGLGLYVARAIVKRHAGAIGVRANQGGGSVFWFALPLRAGL